MIFFLPFAISLVVSLLATRLLISIAPKIGLIDKPNARKVHSNPMPRAGGIAIFLAFIAGLLGTGLLATPIGLPRLPDPLWHFVAGTVFIFLLGVLDDIFDLSPRWKFLGQFALATWMITVGFRIQPLGIPLLDHPYVLSAITWVWIVGITNAVNLIDGMDGLAAGISLLVLTSMAVIASMAHNEAVLFLVLPLAGAALGFLRYNFNPAKIFMGDCGSLFLGFSLAMISVVNTSVRSTIAGFMISIVALGVPLFDTLFSMARRMLVGRKPFSPDREHIHHKILAKGFTHRQAVLILYGITALLCAISFAMVVSNSSLVGALLSAYPVVVYLLIRNLDWIPRIVHIQQRRLRAARMRRYRQNYRDESFVTRVSRSIVHSTGFQWFLDVGVIFAAWALAVFLTHNWEESRLTLHQVSLILVGPAIQCLCWAALASYFKSHHDVWKYIEFNGIGRHVKPMVLAALFAGLFSDVLVGQHWSGRFLTAVLLCSVAGIVVVRLLPNFYYNFARRQTLVLREGPRVVIFGAGDLGELSLRVINIHSGIPYQIVGFIDDDPMKLGKAIYGVRVLGGLAELDEILKKHPFDILLFSTTPRQHAHRWGLSQKLQKLGIKTLKFDPQFGSVLVGTMGHEQMKYPQTTGAKHGRAA